jgi:hypothetical protein
MKILLLTLLFIPLAMLGQQSTNYQEMGLEELNAYLFTEYALHKNTLPLNEVATDDFVLIAAPGMIENKKQAIDGVKHLNLSSVNITVDKVINGDDLGIVIGVLEMKGTIMNNPIPGKMRFSSTFVKQDGSWRLQARTMTPMRMRSKKQ